ncbi:hypothetical protein P280DRAFT_473567 [Massarina eburnea CBS 473.64]|uniref:Uncharacterized protein n=1 Tax=Massarina eburnea CBS 473.64 TaxID=1395130 RepID=A0A6A6RLG9_9PLEO|nr:hypothetical protein P280DRAFT_473567 [Massarina eburnea CBS 473.64]
MFTVADLPAATAYASFIGMLAFLTGYSYYYIRASKISPSEFPKKPGTFEWS